VFDVAESMSGKKTFLYQYSINMNACKRRLQKMGIKYSMEIGRNFELLKTIRWMEDLPNCLK